MKFKLLFIFLCVFTTSFAGNKIEEGWSFYQEEGKWGVLYKEEPCLLPRFDGVSGSIEFGRFAYKEKNQYGIATVWKKITEPFCDSLVWIHEHEHPSPYSPTLGIYKKDGKWGICSTDGATILPPIYQKINKKIYNFGEVFRVYPRKYYKKPLQYYIYYFLINDGISNKMIDILGNTIIPDIGNFEDFICTDGKGNPATIKKAKKKEWGRKNKDEINKVKEIYSKVVSADNATSLYGDYQSWNSDSWDYTERCEYMKEPRMIYFGKNTKVFGEKAVINGFESFVNDYGFISTPLMYDSPYFKLQNNPVDIMSLLYYIDMDRYKNRYYSRIGKKNKVFIYEEYVRNGKVEENISRMEKRLVDYQELINMSKELNDTLSNKIIQKKYEVLTTELKDLKIAYEKEVKRINSIDKINKFTNIATSVLNSVANAIGEPSAKTSSYSSTAIKNSSFSTKSSTQQGSQMSMTDQVNYNSLRNTYNKWAQDLMEMKNANGKYQNGFKVSDKKYAQDKMKQIRKMSMQKWNKEIPYNSIEDW